MDTKLCCNILDTTMKELVQELNYVSCPNMSFSEWMTDRQQSTTLSCFMDLVALVDRHEVAVNCNKLSRMKALLKTRIYTRFWQALVSMEEGWGMTRPDQEPDTEYEDGFTA